MKTLCILGNGFDIHHGLKTSYADFHNYLNSISDDLIYALEEYFSFKVDNHYLWKDFENDLSSYDHKSFFANYNHIDILDDSFRHSEVYGLEDEIIEETDNLIQKLKNALTNWIEVIEYPKIEEIREKMLSFPSDTQFLNFNYTCSLEVLYKIPKENILYLHNNVEETSDDLIFGHGQMTEKYPKPAELDENGDSTRSIFTDSEDAARSPFYSLQKNTDEILNAHRSFFEELKTITNVIVLGHSISDVDWPYFQEILLQVPHAKWEISYYSDGEKVRLARKFPKNVIVKMIKLEEYTIKV